MKISNKWVKVKGSDAKYPTILENRGNNEYVKWEYSMFGAIGHAGELKKGIEVEPLKTKQDFIALENLEKLINKAVKNSDIMYQRLKNR